jgi:hypothetical protein
MEMPAFEFYAGDAKRIAAAALAGQWDLLHGGKITPYVALFPVDSTASQVDLIEELVAVVSGSSPVRFRHHGKTLVDVDDDGLSVGTMPVAWVNSLASLSDEQTKMMASSLRTAFRAVYNDLPDESMISAWQKPLEDLVCLCKQAQRKNLEVVEVFLADW